MEDLWDEMTDMFDNDPDLWLDFKNAEDVDRQYVELMRMMLDPATSKSIPNVVKRAVICNFAATRGMEVLNDACGQLVIYTGVWETETGGLADFNPHDENDNPLKEEE